jgi:hypothetical protein
MQTAWMALQLVQDTVLNEAVNGIITDAAHGYWRMNNWLLIISSVYSRFLCSWTPVLFTVANGGTIEHYRIHFLALFKSLAEECENRGQPVTDNLFGIVVDFSAAEAGGFVAAFVDFWTSYEPTKRTLDELEIAAQALLKGCEQHFRTGITRLKKVSGVIKPALADAFESRALALLDAEDVNSFTKMCGALLRDFPNVENWLQWWQQERPARMLFKPFRVMSDELWQKLPRTTNAEEALHFRLYAAVGRDLGLLEGLEGLFKFAEHLQTMSTAQGVGIPIRYGKPEPWKL